MNVRLGFIGGGAAAARLKNLRTFDARGEQERPACGRGLPMFIEKPVPVNLEQAEEVGAHVGQSGDAAGILPPSSDGLASFGLLVAAGESFRTGQAVTL